MRRALLGIFVPLLMWADRSEIDFDPEADFTQFKTFAIRRGAVHTKKPELNNDLVHKKVEAALRARLTAKGLTEATTKPDLGVVWSLGAAERREVRRTPAGRRGWRSRVDPFRYTEGTLVIDLIQTGTRELVYRATYIDDESNAGKLSQKLEKDVAKALDKYPPPSKK
jgi:hypothetical protein